MSAKELLDVCERIRIDQLWSRYDLARNMNLSYTTLVRLERYPETCAMKSRRKLVAFVNHWQYKKPALS